MERELLVVLTRIEAKLDALLAMGSSRGNTALAPTRASDAEVAMLRGFTRKQNLVLQMLLRGKSNTEIAGRFGVSVNTAKVYVRTIAKKLGVHTRAQIAINMMPVWETVSPVVYEMATGVPKDWDEHVDSDKRYQELMED